MLGRLDKALFPLWQHCGIVGESQSNMSRSEYETFVLLIAPVR